MSTPLLPTNFSKLDTRSASSFVRSELERNLTLDKALLPVPKLSKPLVPVVVIALLPCSLLEKTSAIPSTPPYKLLKVFNSGFKARLAPLTSIGPKLYPCSFPSKL